METVVYRSKPEWNCLHQQNNHYLHETEESIPQNLCNVLLEHATDQLEAQGFDEAVKDWKVEIYTTDGDREDLEERAYCVRWINKKDGHIEVVGIFLNNGKANINHGLVIG